MIDFPCDADGDVLRRLRDGGFDFSRPVTIDFNVDFESWPPPQSAVDLLVAEYSNVSAYDPRGSSPGYLLIQVHDRLNYALVIAIQEKITRLMTPFRGKCESWGVMH